MSARPSSAPVRAVVIAVAIAVALVMAAGSAVAAVHRGRRPASAVHRGHRPASAARQRAMKARRGHRPARHARTRSKKRRGRSARSRRAAPAKRRKKPRPKPAASRLQTKPAAPAKTTGSTTTTASTATPASSGAAPAVAAPASGNAAATATATVVAGSVGAKMPCVYASDHISILNAFGAAVGRAFDCAGVYNDASPNWTTWARPWFINNTYADESWKAWATAPGTHRTLIITQNMFPASENSDPNVLAEGAAGDFESYAAALATNLVQAGLGSAVIRLGHEANGNWYPDSIPNTPTGDAQWIQFWRNTVIAMRSVPGAHFQFDWTVNAGYRRIPLSEWYPGDDVVNIVGIDAYDAGVPANVAYADRWSYLYNQPDGIGAVVTFAAAHGKPLSLGEWGIEPAQAPGALAGGDDPAYVRGIASVVANDNVAYQSYFDSGDIGTELMASPQSLQAYRNAFGAAGTALSVAFVGPQTPAPSPAPWLSITGGPANDSTVYGASATFAYAVQPGYGATCKLDGQGWRPCTSGSSDVLTGLAPGFHVWDVQVADANQAVTFLGRAFAVSSTQAAPARATRDGAHSRGTPARRHRPKRHRAGAHPRPTRRRHRPVARRKPTA